MGLIFSLVFGRSPPPSTTDSETAVDTLIPASVPESSVTLPTVESSPERTSGSSTSLTVANTAAACPTQPHSSVYEHYTDSPSLQRTEEFIRRTCIGEYYENASYYEDRIMRDLILEELPYVNITRVCVVKNNYLLGMYQLKKAEYQSRYGTVKEVMKFHATDARNVDSIIKDNLDWRRVYRNKYGIGVSFSGDPDYCNFHCTRQNGSRRVFVVADVLVGRQTYGGQGLVIPPDNYDTAVGNNDLVYVKFENNEFLPKYLVFYDAPPRPSSKYWVNYRRW